MKSIHVVLIAVVLMVSRDAAAQGSQWKVYELGKTIRTICEENDSIIWYARGFDVARMNKRSETMTYYSTVNSGLPASTVTSIVIDKANNKCMATTGGGLAIFDGSQWTVYKNPGSTFIYTGVYALTTDKKGDLWMSVDSWSNKALVQFDGSTWTVHSNGTDLPGDVLRSLAFDPSGNLWIGTGGKGLVKYGLGWTHYPLVPSGTTGSDVSVVATDSSGNLWYTAGGLSKFDGVNWTTYTASDSPLPNSPIRSITIEKNNTIWIGTWGGGVAKFDGVNWTIYTHSNGLADDYVNDVVVDKHNNKWIATTNGLTLFNENGVTGVATDDEHATVREFTLEQNYPNPFNPETAIGYWVMDNGNVDLRVYDLLGREVAVLMNEGQLPGYHTVTWNAAGMPSGVYCYRLRIGESVFTRTMALIR
jgi:streptogramin lyase